MSPGFNHAEATGRRIGDIGFNWISVISYSRNPLNELDTIEILAAINALRSNALARNPGFPSSKIIESTPISRDLWTNVGGFPERIRRSYDVASCRIDLNREPENRFFE